MLTMRRKILLRYFVNRLPKSPTGYPKGLFGELSSSLPDEENGIAKQ